MLLPEESLKEVISTQYFAVLNTIGNGLPYSNLVSFAITDDFRSLVFVTDRNTRKYRNMRENAEISMLIDNRTNQPSDVVKAIAITIIGSAREDTDKNSDLKAIFLSRHPQLKQFVDAPYSAIMLVTVREYIIAGFDKTKYVVVS